MTDGSPTCCPKPNLQERPLLTPGQAVTLAEVFKVLANDSRLRLLHGLVRSGEQRVTELAALLSMTPHAVSNQLQRLADQGIVRSRREGTQMYYTIVDPCVTALMDRGLCLIEDRRAPSCAPWVRPLSNSGTGWRRKSAGAAGVTAAS